MTLSALDHVFPRKSRGMVHNFWSARQRVAFRAAVNMHTCNDGASTEEVKGKRGCVMLPSSFAVTRLAIRHRNPCQDVVAL